ncbi:MAG TPA: nucleoside triphosphate pyrophosphohydrolase family protein [Patescibacteria group bacterium]|nr:nucleoside triphosphate pyrophosphohydrolase family protein [Patescibacteria group bacterium]
MKPIEYQEEAKRTMNFDLTHNEQLSMLAMGLSGESGEVTDYLKKVVYHDHPYSGKKLCDELGDVMWYLSNLAYINGIDLEIVMEENIKKLKKRYPEGFSVEASLLRADTPISSSVVENKDKVHLMTPLLRRLWYLLSDPIRFLFTGEVAVLEKEPNEEE